MHVPSTPWASWINGIIVAALGISASACADRVIDDPLFGDEFGDDTDETSTGETTTGETTTGQPNPWPSEPFDCPSADVVVEGPVGPNGTCGSCDEACYEAGYAAFDGAPYYCDDAGSCWCDVYLACSAAIPNENGQCLHGFVIDYYCGEGRPLLADTGEVRVAATLARRDWLCPVPTLLVPEPLREQVLAGWLDRAAMEHASVAAFARFTLQLQSIGAPAKLIAAAQASGRDELRHAQQCYAVASQLAGHALGPGPLDVSGVGTAATPARIVWESILEGCIGETIAAAKMRYLAGVAASPQLRALLEQIAADEARHAALAWQALRWMVESFALHDVAREAFAAALADSARVPTPSDDLLAPHGVLSEATSAWISASVLRQVIAPAAAAVLGAGQRHGVRGHAVACS